MIGLLLFWLFYAPVETTISMRVIPQWGNAPMILNKPYRLNTDSISIQQWKCYLQVIALYKNNQLVYTFKKNHHLLDAENERSFQWALSIPTQLEYDAVEFEIGVDSITQSEGVQGHDLDPENDMYWSWQSGYIHTKLEATILNSNRKYSLHIGGYRSPYNTLQHYRIPVYTPNNIILSCPVDNWMEKAIQHSFSQIMRPCSEAVLLSNEWAKTWKSLTL